MSLGTLPLSYCTNVHPGRTLAEVEHGLDSFTVRVREQYEHPLAAGLWLAQPVIEELLDSPGAVDRFSDGLQNRDLVCYTLNAFPYGNFHDERVKENVYIPDWTRPERLEYTHNCAKILAKLMPDGTEGSISTVPLGFKEFEHSEDFDERCISQLIKLACRLDVLHDETGKRVRLAIEPEPFCLLETTSEAIEFFQKLWTRADDVNAREPVRNHLGLCYDVCHQAVEFEDVDESIRSLEKAGVRINKVHITCAIELEQPGENVEGRKALARYVEPRYLHQTLARGSDGSVHRVVDLSKQLALEPTAEFAAADLWRIHFHVPVDAEQLGPLKTTRADLKKSLETVVDLPYAPHLEVETYTWEVLPDGQKTDLVDGLTRELTATRSLLQKLGRNS